VLSRQCETGVRNAALLQQFHKRDAFEAELVGSLARRDSAIRKKGENGFFPQVFLESGLVGGLRRSGQRERQARIGTKRGRTCVPF
jgi:hypothetical protein